MKIISPCLFVVFFYLTLISQALAESPDLESDSDLATAGYFRLSWHGSDLNDSNNDDYLLQEASDPDFSSVKTLYEGPDTASLVSGRINGVYYYRVGKYGVQNNNQAEELSSWSNVVKVEVAHHPLSRAFMFFALGAIVFLATFVVVITGSRTYRQ